MPLAVTQEDFLVNFKMAIVKIILHDGRYFNTHVLTFQKLLSGSSIHNHKQLIL